ncbi:SAM-dependent methyltransferase [Streptomyces niveus]|uniref:SAM-dependent methyltransferase n=1 Tax=Streptomyces niveus TaxID=193462 RepID=UPI003661485A
MDGTERDLGQDRAHSARVQDYHLGGKTNYLVDRAAGDAITARFPTMGIAARVGRAYMQRAGDYLARRGVRQYVDVGTGIPAVVNLHDVIHAVTPGAQVVYVDHDPIVLTYADELVDLLHGTTHVVDADVRQPEELLTAVEKTGAVHFGHPVSLSLHALLDYITDDADPYGLVGRLMRHLAPGSYLSLTHSTADLAPDAWEAAVGAYTRHGIPVRPRSRTEVLRFFRGLGPVDPGLVVAHRWRPEPASGPSLVTDGQVSLYAGIARKPAAP